MKSCILLSLIACDPEVAAFFARGERDDGQEPALPAPNHPKLSDGQAERHTKRRAREMEEA